MSLFFIYAWAAIYWCFETTILKILQSFCGYEYIGCNRETLAKMNSTLDIFLGFVQNFRTSHSERWSNCFLIRMRLGVKY